MGGDLSDWRDRARLRPAELARIAGVSRATIDRAIRRGELPSHRVGRLRFVAIADALAYVGEAQRSRAAERPARSISDEARRLVAKLVKGDR